MSYLYDFRYNLELCGVKHSMGLIFLSLKYSSVLQEQMHILSKYSIQIFF